MSEQWKHRHTMACRYQPELGYACYYSPEEEEIRRLERVVAERNSAIRSVAHSFGIAGAYADPPATITDLLVAIEALAERNKH